MYGFGYFYPFPLLTKMIWVLILYSLCLCCLAGNVLPAEEILADSQGLTDASNKQETKETEDTADTEIPKIQVDLVAPEVVAGAVDSDGQEDEREDTQTDGSSTEKIPCSELGNDFGMCVRSLSDMNVTIRRLDTGMYTSVLNIDY